MISKEMLCAVRELLSLYKDIQTGILIPNITSVSWEASVLRYKRDCPLCVVGRAKARLSEEPVDCKCYYCPWIIYDGMAGCTDYPFDTVYGVNSYHFEIGDYLEPSIHRLQRWIERYERDLLDATH